MWLKCNSCSQVGLEYVDKSAIFEVEMCEPDADYREDDCLFQCLADRFADEFGCIHSRYTRNRI